MKRIKKRKGNYKIFGYTNGCISYGVNAKGDYRIEIDHSFFGCLKLYQSKKKPKFRNIIVLTYLIFPFLYLMTPIFFCVTIINMYGEGAINFVRDRANQTNVRFFNYINILLVFIFFMLWVFNI